MLDRLFTSKKALPLIPNFEPIVALVPFVANLKSSTPKVVASVFGRTHACVPIFTMLFVAGVCFDAQAESLNASLLVESL